MIVDAAMATSLGSRMFSNWSWIIGLTVLFVSTSSRAALNHSHAELVEFERVELAQDEDFDSDSEVQSESKTSIKVPFTGKRPMLLDAHIGMFPAYGFGGTIGARFGFPVMHNGFVKSINNAVYIVAGLDLGITTWFHRTVAFTFAIPVQLNWEFYFTDKWSAFAELGLVFRMTPAFRYFDSRVLPFGGWIAGDVGGRYHLSDRIALVLRVGSPSTVFGATFKF